MQDIEQIRSWRNRQMDVLRQSKKITVEQQRNYYYQHVWPEMALEEPKQLLVSLFHKKNHIGYGGLTPISWEHRRAEIAFLVDDRRANDKITYENDFRQFLDLIKKLAFRHLKLNRLYTETYAIRGEHIAILESSGFVLEGRMKAHIYIKNKPVDSLIHGYLSANYEREENFC